MAEKTKDLYSWTASYKEIKAKHDQAFVAIDQAISLEEHEKPIEAIEKYKEGIQLIDEALNVQVQYPEDPDPTWEKACSMIQKIKKTRAEVLMRINTIQGSSDYVPPETLEGPPSYDEAIATSSSSSSDVPRTYKDLATALNELSIDPNQTMEEDVIYTHDGVRLYFISPNGDVLSTQEPQLLKISMVQGDEPNAPKAILQVGNFVYPLVPGVSPCYRTNYGAFILPNVHAEIPGSSVGIILPSDADSEVFDLLESILHGIISHVTEEGIQEWRRRREEAEDYSSQISDRIVNGAWHLSQNIIRGAQKAGEFFNSTTPKLISKLPPAHQPASVPRPLSKTMKVAECATSTAAKVTGVVAEKVGIATTRLGQFLAPHIQKQGTRLLATTTNLSEQEAHKKVKSVLTVAAGAVEAFSTVYRGLETSASILGNSLKENTVKIVEHK
ncbi:unnamed protein product [Acanthoscelides obtectus]|nr:unnamed protein product [Acanthoscelides obtectus]CAK1631945.1 Protein spartin [Acanthoscelides obtectus]